MQAVHYTSYRENFRRLALFSLELRPGAGRLYLFELNSREPFPVHQCCKIDHPLHRPALCILGVFLHRKHSLAYSLVQRVDSSPYSSGLSPTCAPQGPYGESHPHVPALRGLGSNSMQGRRSDHAANYCTWHVKSRQLCRPDGVLGWVLGSSACATHSTTFAWTTFARYPSSFLPPSSPPRRGQAKHRFSQGLDCSLRDLETMLQHGFLIVMVQGLRLPQEGVRSSCMGSLRTLLLQNQPVLKNEHGECAPRSSDHLY